MGSPRAIHDLPVTVPVNVTVMGEGDGTSETRRDETRTGHKLEWNGSRLDSCNALQCNSRAQHSTAQHSAAQRARGNRQQLSRALSAAAAQFSGPSGSMRTQVTGQMANGGDCDWRRANKCQRDSSCVLPLPLPVPFQSRAAHRIRLQRGTPATYFTVLHSRTVPLRQCQAVTRAIVAHCHHQCQRQRQCHTTRRGKQ